MSKYRVTIPFAVWVSLEVEGEDKESAIDTALDEVYLTGYCGNNGTDKLIGVTTGSIEAGEEFIDGTITLNIDAEEI